MNYEFVASENSIYVEEVRKNKIISITGQSERRRNRRDRKREREGGREAGRL